MISKILNLLTSNESLLPCKVLEIWDHYSDCRRAYVFHCPVVIFYTHRQQWLPSEEKYPNLVVELINRKGNVGTQVNKSLKES